VATADDVITFADLKDRERQLGHTGACSHPVRLHGRVTALDLATGDAAPVYDTASEPGGVLHVACGNRRDTRCPACSQVYKRDARQLVRAGLTGGKGVPETVSAHPCVFATLTAPSFGPVHARRMRGKTVLPCRPRRDRDDCRCEHGRDVSCPVRHSEHDPRLGRPMCGDCFDYEAAVLFNLHATALWRRFTTYLPRHLARLAGVTRKTLKAELRIRFVKIAEYQARGVIHFHAVIRLDAHTKDGFTPPPARYTAALLCEAIALASKGGPHHRARLRPGHPPQFRPRTRRSAHLAQRALVDPEIPGHLRDRLAGLPHQPNSALPEVLIELPPRLSHRRTPLP
jgi:Replication initiator protein, pSAM2